MRICFVAPATNYHTKKWCKWFAEQGHEIHVISFVYEESTELAKVHFIDTGAGTTAGDLKKLKYLLFAKKIKKIVDEINPDIINVHYATSYGTAVALSGIKEYVLSVWGSDIYEFPNKSILHKLMLQYSLKKAKYLFSTSQAMADEAKKYTNKRFEITPFGVDLGLFSANKRTRGADKSNEEEYIIGTVKSLGDKYGIDYFLKAAAILKKNHPEIPVKLRIAGKGPKEQAYKELAVQLQIEDIVTWCGFISQEEAAKEWANMDVAVVYSNQESFGVSAVEAEACEVPVVISDIPGLIEATKPGASSIVVEKRNEELLAKVLLELYNDRSRRVEMGKNGRKFVEDNYEINDCFRKVENFFKTISKC